MQAILWNAFKVRLQACMTATCQIAYFETIFLFDCSSLFPVLNTVTLARSSIVKAQAKSLIRQRDTSSSVLLDVSRLVLQYSLRFRQHQRWHQRDARINLTLLAVWPFRKAQLSFQSSTLDCCALNSVLATWLLSLCLSQCILETVLFATRWILSSCWRTQLSFDWFKHLLSLQRWWTPVTFLLVWA